MSSKRIKPSMASSTVPTLEVQIQHNQNECWVYSWDRDQAQLRITGLQPAHVDLPADLASLHLEKQVEVPVYVFAPVSIAPGTLVTVCILGAFHPSIEPDPGADVFPLTDWTLLAVPDIAGLVPVDEVQVFLSCAQQEALRQHLQSQQDTPSGELILCSATTVAPRLREARVWLKRAQRRQAGVQRKPAREGAAVAWRAIEGLTPEQRVQVAQARTSAEVATLLQPEHLIHFVPLRFQNALEKLLLDDERLLAFLERPLLHRRAGWLGMQQHRANAGLLLVTDRQVLWLRDYFSSGVSQFPEGFIARSVPAERLTDLILVPTETSSSALGLPLAEETSPYLRLVLVIGSNGGQEFSEVAFPVGRESTEALERISTMLRAFVPLAGPQERRLRRLPVVEPWIPQGDAARRLAGLGGVVTSEVKQSLEQRLAEVLHATGEELLVAATVPALEEYRSPARLVALTRTAVLTLNAFPEDAPGLWKAPKGYVVQKQRYDLAEISSAQLSYSLLGSGLHLWLPQADGHTQEVTIPFHSPAISWFLPLFTRLRLLLSLPLSLLSAPETRPGA